MSSETNMENIFYTSATEDRKENQMPIKITDKHVFFYHEWLSNFWEAPFEYKGHSFFCNEQAFMWEKAVLFGDKAMAEKILVASTPLEAKSLGRKVTPFDNEKWNAVCYQIMLDINFAKFSQVEDCKKRLLDPMFDGHIFVEASPRDRKWGVGLSVNNPGIDDPANWRGRNLLGKVITEVRDRLVAANAAISP